VQSGQYVIDTTGAAAIVARYTWDMAYRRYPFFRNHAFSQHIQGEQQLLIDAVFIRDYHGDDTTAFTLSNKNGDSPASWAAGVQVYLIKMIFLI
jgi:hypothetical protein